MDDAAEEASLAARGEQFLALHGRRPTVGDIQADEAWWALFRGRKEREREAALRVPGGCSVYIARRRRYCTHAAADGLGGLCSEHAAAAAAVPQPPPPPAAAAAAVGGSKKSNLKRRMKRMSNPLSVRACSTLPPWPSLFADPSLPTLLDVGCAKGRFLAALAAPDSPFSLQYGLHNCLGMELWAPLVAAANASARAARGDGPGNLHYLAGNANASLQLLSTGLPNLNRICIQFPDPWQEDESHKRLVTPALVSALAMGLQSNGEVFLVSDKRSLAQEMRETFLAAAAADGSPLFTLHAMHLTAGRAEGWCVSEDGAGVGRRTRKEGEKAAGTEVNDETVGQGGEEEGEVMPPPGGWLRLRPYHLPTERDKVCEKLWRPVYRTLLTRTSAAACAGLP